MVPLNTTEDYDVTKTVLRHAFLKHGPYALGSSGCPEDEYDAVIATVLTLSRGTTNPQNLASIIAEVLTKSFGDQFEAADCLDVAKSAMEQLAKKGISL